MNALVEYISTLSPGGRRLLYSSPRFTTCFLRVMDQETVSLIYTLLLSTSSTTSNTSSVNLLRKIQVIRRERKIPQGHSTTTINGHHTSNTTQGHSTTTINGHHTSNTTQGHHTSNTTHGHPNTTILSLDSLYRSSLLKGLTVISDIKIVEGDSFLDTVILHKNVDMPLLVFGGLLTQEGGITNKGFEFLLKTRHEQMWSIVILGIKYYYKREEEQIKILEGILACEVEGRIKRMMERLGIYKEGEWEGYSTRDSNKDIITTGLFSSSPLGYKNRFIIVETNYKVYAYTQSEYQVSVIKLFSSIVSILPGLIKGILNEESVGKAFNKGITARQIINYLEGNVRYPLHPSIINQIEIWENKRKRMILIEGYLYSDFINLRDYEKVVEYCEEREIIVEKDKEKRIIVIVDDEEENKRVKEYCKKLVKGDY